MGIRSKLLLPLLLLSVSIAGIIHLYWLPQFRTSETIELQKRELATMEAVTAALIPSLLSGDLAQIHATLDQLLERHNGWETLYLKAADGNYLYPIFPSPVSRQNDTEKWLEFPADYDGKRLATLELKIDIDSLLANQLGQVQLLVRILFLTVFSIALLAALLQERWIRRPLRTLVAATSRITSGDYKLTLPKVSSSDEVSKLITAFDSMRVNLAKREATLSEQNALLDAVQAAQARFIRDTSGDSLFNKLLADMLVLTESEHGFIGEILYRDENPYIKTLAIRNITQHDDSFRFDYEHSQQGAELINLQTQIETVITARNTLIANNLEESSRAGGINVGDPPPSTFLGIPFLRGDKVIGMIGVANRANGYDQALVQFLGPIIATCTQLMEALKADRQRERTEEQLRERETRMRTIFENVVDGIITTNEKGVIESFNRAAENMFGYSADEILGRNVSILTPTNHQHRHDRYIKDYLNGRESKIMGTGREVEGVRKDGSIFPVDIAVTEMRLGEDRHFCSIMRDITGRKEVERMKNEFISVVSHELRTPLTSIRGALGLVASGTVGDLPDQAQPFVDIAARNCDRLVRLINDILDIEKIEANKMDFTLQPFELMHLVSQAVESIRIYAGQNGANIVVSDGMPGAVVLVDEDRFTQVLTNLLSNAAKFSPQNGTIRVSTQASNDGVRLSVSDEGPGIPEAFSKQIFEKFSQADASDSRQKAGTGLGLSITKAIVNKLGGEITFETQQGKGATFYVDLPVHPEPAPANTSATRMLPACSG